MPLLPLLTAFGLWSEGSYVLGLKFGSGLGLGLRGLKFGLHPTAA